MTLYVGNLSHQAGEQEVNDLFAGYGQVKSVKLIKDHVTGRPRGFAFVEMAEEAMGQSAIDALHDTEFMQRKLVVNQARPKTSGGGDRNSSFSGGGGRRDYNRSY